MAKPDKQGTVINVSKAEWYNRKLNMKKTNFKARKWLHYVAADAEMKTRLKVLWTLDFDLAKLIKFYSTNILLTEN